MFPMGQILILVAIVLLSAVACLCGFITGSQLVFLYGLGIVGFVGLLLVGDRDRTIRRCGFGVVTSAMLGAILVFGLAPAHASAAVDLVWNGPHMASATLASDVGPLIAAPAGDTAFWGTINGWVADALGALVVAVVGWACKAFTARTRIAIRADQEAQIRETMKTGAYQAMHELEVAIDDHWTPAQRGKVVDRVVNWAETRAEAQLKKLGLPSFVVTAMARKVVGQLQASLGLDATDAVTAVANFHGNPGETPALDRAAGGTGGA